MILVIGLGFVGLTTALGFASKGFHVFGYDVNEALVESLKQKKIPFFEPELDNRLSIHLGDNFEIVSSLDAAINKISVIFLCVGTPSRLDGSADISHVLTAINDVIKLIKLNEGGDKTSGAYRVLVVKSTVPPSTTSSDILKHIEQQGYVIGRDFGLANNPEFLREGKAWEDFNNQDRIVIGTEDEKSKLILQDIYRSFTCPLHIVSYNTGEFIKYLSNTLLATLISYANDMSMVAKAIGGVDVRQAFQILYEDNRWHGTPANMSSYVFPGCGFGGYCLPKDTAAMYARALEKGYESRFLKEVLAINENIKSHHINNIVKTLNDPSSRIALLGLSFKPHSDDIRGTQSKDIIQLLLERNYKNLVAHDPMALDSFKRAFDFPIAYSETVEQAVEGSTAVIIMTAWPEYQDKSFLFENKILFDLRYFINRSPS